MCTVEVSGEALMPGDKITLTIRDISMGEKYVVLVFDHDNFIQLPLSRPVTVQPSS